MARRTCPSIWRRNHGDRSTRRPHQRHRARAGALPDRAADDPSRAPRADRHPRGRGRARPDRRRLHQQPAHPRRRPRPPRPPAPTARPERRAKRHAIAAPTPVPSPEAELIIYNWLDYIGEDVIPSFEEKYPVKVKYELFDDI